MAAVLLDRTAPARPVIAEALSRLRAPELDVTFGAVIADRDMRIHRAAVEFLRQADTAVARRALAAGLTDTRAAACAAVLAVVEGIDDPDMAVALRQTLRTTPPATCWYLLTALTIQRTSRDVIADELAEYVLGHADSFVGPPDQGFQAAWVVIDTCTEAVLARLLAELVDSSLPMPRRELVTTILRELVNPRTRSKHDLPVSTMTEPVIAALRDPTYDADPRGLVARGNLVFIAGGLDSEAVRRPLLDVLARPQLSSWDIEVAIARCRAECVDAFLHLLDNPSTLAARNRAHAYKNMVKTLLPFRDSDPRVEACLHRFLRRTGDHDVELAASMLHLDLPNDEDEYEED
ncbi:hypothetical protein [Nocardia sp. NPDC052316]|uniref:hypothetical protein n=1 Tax=Nocardia sp. NPDC052316 TaxID=3364329 RepID=UPI0037C80CC2